MTELVAVVTVRDVTAKVVDVAPDATVTLAGTVAAPVLLLDNVTVRCVELPAAGALNVTVAVAFVDPPTTVAGFSASATTCGSCETVSRALCEPPFDDAVIVAEVGAVTTLLVTVNVAEVAPLDTVTVAGTVAAAVLLLDSVTVRCVESPAAGAFKATVPVAFVAPPTTLAGFSVTATT